MSKKKDKKKEKKEKPKKAEKLLSSFHCTGCKKECPLNKPHCKKGKAQAEALLKKMR